MNCVDYNSFAFQERYIYIYIIFLKSRGTELIHICLITIKQSLSLHMDNTAYRDLMVTL